MTLNLRFDLDSFLRKNIFLNQCISFNQPTERQGQGRIKKKGERKKKSLHTNKHVEPHFTRGERMITAC